MLISSFFLPTNFFFSPLYQILLFAFTHFPPLLHISFFFPLLLLFLRPHINHCTFKELPERKGT